jgi:hypothetical protein
LAIGLVAFSGRFAGGGLGLAIKMAGPSCTSLLVPSKARLDFHSVCPRAKNIFELFIDDGIFS